MDSLRFNELIEKISLSVDEKRSNPWVSPNIRKKSADIKRIRQKFGVTEAGLAEILGVSENTVHDWENGEKEPEKALALLLRIAEMHPDVFLDTLWGY